MKKFFLDTNVLIDFLSGRAPFGKSALRIFDQALKGRWQLWTSDNSITTAYYIIEKTVGAEAARIKIGKMLNYLSIQPVEKRDLEAALTSAFKDFEDGVQYFCAMQIDGIEGIITGNTKDFKASRIQVFRPDEV